MIGNFEVTSGRLLVTDPCYDVHIVDGVLENAKKGKWQASIQVDGDVPSELTCEHVGSRIVRKQKAFFEVGVDSGQAGVFDVDHYNKDENLGEFKWEYQSSPLCDDKMWYSMCCDRTLSEEMAGVVPGGAVSTSGRGDGVYSATIGYNENDEVVLVEIDFSEGEEYDDEEEE